MQAHHGLWTMPRLWGVLALLIFPILSCSSRGNKSPAEHPNVLLILVDTLRADKLGCYGNDLGLTPHIDALAKEGVRFSHAFSHAPWTLPSVASLLTSTYPETHGAGHHRRKGRLRYTRINPSLVMLAECFKAQGYDTSAIVNVTFMSPKLGMSRGFVHYDFTHPRYNLHERRAKAVTDLAIQQIQMLHKANRPFFLLAHYFDPHLTYDPPAKFRRRFAGALDRDPGPPIFGARGDMIRYHHGQIPLKSVPIKRLEKLYDGEIASADEQIGRLLNALATMGLKDTTLVVMTADHGEEFLDHGGFEHGHTLYDELLHIPLILRYPHMISPGVLDATVGHIDVAPTICQVSGINPASTFTGRSLVPMFMHEHMDNHPILSQGNMWGKMWTAWRDGGYKLIKRPSGLELYHVADDPHEKNNLFRVGSYAARRQTMLRELQRTVRTARRQRRKDSGVVTMTQEERERLKALGYVGGDNGEDGGDNRPDKQPTTNPHTE